MIIVKANKRFLLPKNTQIDCFCDGSTCTIDDVSCLRDSDCAWDDVYCKYDDSCPHIDEACVKGDYI